MPITPFHGGIGLACKGPFGRRFSFTIFTATQVVIDLESAYFLWTGQHPVHRFFHTFIGAGVVGIFVAIVLRPWCERLLDAASRVVGVDGPKWIDLTPRIAVPVALGSAAVGVLGHVIPDSIMHADARPLAPFSDANPLLDLVSLEVLHAALVILGVLGFVWLEFAAGRQRPTV